MTAKTSSSDTSKQTPIRVCVLNSSYENSNASMKDYDDVICTPEYSLQGDPNYTFTNVMIHKKSAYSQIRDLVNSRKYDVFFNLCDGAKDEDRAGVTVVQALEEFKVPFTGSDSLHFEPSKVEMKMLAFYAGIKVPPFARVTAHDDLSKVCSHLKFPLIVKHVSGYGSIGMSKDSKCPDFETLEKEARRFIDAFGEVLVEEFIDGVEVNVLAFEDLDGQPSCVLEPIQILFPDGETFKHFDMKWKSGIFAATKIDDSVLRQKIKHIGLAAFEHILGGIGYGRSDLRVCAKTGEVYLLEINPNCGCFYPVKDGTADLIMELDEMKPAGVARHFIQAAINRNKRLLEQASPCAVVFHPQKGYHVCATRNIDEGEVVFRDESSSFRLVTKSHVAKSWNALDKQAFAQYAWPLSREVFVTWSPDFRAWRPINHSCSPNLWFGENHSLNVYARRAIKVGDELTMDYATFCSGPLMHSFACNCRSPNCRKQITPLDYNQRPELRQEYGTRVTDYIYDESQATTAKLTEF